MSSSASFALASSSTGADFQDLLQEAEQMTAQIDKENEAGAGLPRLQRTLSQLFDSNKRKLAKTGGHLGSNEINASILLAGKGIDAPKLTQTIESLHTEAAAAPGPEQLGGAERSLNLEVLRDADLKSFLKAERDAALMSLIEETNKQTMLDIDDFIDACSDLEWEKQKQKIMQEMMGSFAPEVTLATSGSGGTMRSVAATGAGQPGASGQPGSRTLMSDVEIEFSKEIDAYNAGLVAKHTPRADLLANFVSLAQRLGDKNVEDMWNMLYFMCNNQNGENMDVTQTSDATANNKNVAASSTDRDNSPSAQLHFASQAIAYLEYCFRELLQSTVNSNLKEARLGGALGTLGLCAGYLRLKQSEKYHQSYEETFEADAQPLWPTIYLCLRCGDLDAARSLAAKTKKEDLCAYLDELSRVESGKQRRLSPATEKKLRMDYVSKLKRSADVYKRAVYSYLCRLSDDESINKILDNLDDFLWFKLNSVSFAKEPESLSYSDFQAKLSIEYGEKYFVKNRNPFTYIQVLLLTAQFELAIEFLLKYDTMIIHGVHMTMALYERRMLNLTPSGAAMSQLIAGPAEASAEPKCLRRINFQCLIRMYTRKFECSDPFEALQYYFFLRNIMTTITKRGKPFQMSYFVQYVAELALESREFELLFGRLEKNSVRRPGLLDRFVEEDEVNTIVSLVAEELENKGLVEEAIKMYELCKEHQSVLELCNKQVSQCVSEANVANSGRERLKAMVFAIAMRYKSEPQAANSLKAVQTSTVHTFYLLADLMTFFDLFHAQSWELAYETLKKLGVLPQTSYHVDACIKEFVAFSEEIKRNFPDLILAGMTIYSNLYSALGRTAFTGSPFQNIDNPLLNEKKQLMTQLKEQAKALIKFVSCIPYRLSGDINARLLQLEVTMN